MATLELVSHVLCPFVHRSAALLVEKNVPFTAKFIDLQAKPDWFLALSPRGKVPVLVVDGTPIVESAVILEYLAETYAPELIPADALGRARQRMWVELSTDLLMGQYRVATAGSREDRTRAVGALRDILKRFEAELRGPFFAGDAPGIVDFAAGPGLVRIARLDAWLGLGIYENLPRVTAWSRAINERAAFRDTLVDDFDTRFRASIKDVDAAA